MNCNLCRFNHEQYGTIEDIPNFLLTNTQSRMANKVGEKCQLFWLVLTFTASSEETIKPYLLVCVVDVFTQWSILQHTVALLRVCSPSTFFPLLWKKIVSSVELQRRRERKKVKWTGNDDATLCGSLLWMKRCEWWLLITYLPKDPLIRCPARVQRDETSFWFDLGDLFPIDDFFFFNLTSSSEMMKRIAQIR